MPELPEVETVKNTLKSKILNKRITTVNIYYPNIIEYPKEQFQDKITNQMIKDIKRRGKWLIFELDDYYLLSHLRMEGKYFLKPLNSELNKHEHISFILNNEEELRYHDTRKFGRMYLTTKEELYTKKPLSDIGLEPWDDNLNTEYLHAKLKNKQLPIKTILLDQSIIAGIGNIYADEILYMSKINPLIKGKEIKKEQLEQIIENTRIVLEKAINLGGTTIKSYESSEGVHGRFQNELLIHTKKECPNCRKTVTKIKVGGRGTYYCEDCQNYCSNNVDNRM